MSQAQAASSPSGAAEGVPLAVVPEGLRPPRQERSMRSLRRVLDAGAEVLAEAGWEGFTIADVARRSNASSGLIYKRFANKAALLEAIFVRENERLSSDEDERLRRVADSSESLAAFIAGAVREMTFLARREAALLGVFNERAAVEPHLLEHVKRTRTAPRLFASELLKRRDKIRHADPDFASDMAFWLINASIDRRVHTPMWRHWSADTDQDWAEFVAGLTRAAQAYLLVAPDELESAG